MADAKKKDSELSNDPVVEHRLGEVGSNDAQKETREGIENAVKENLEAVRAQADRALAVAAPVQKVTDGNETAALATITGQRPIRDLSDAPPPEPLGTQEADEKQKAAQS